MKIFTREAHCYYLLLHRKCPHKQLDKKMKQAVSMLKEIKV